jgi:hypothetical protein
MHHQPRDHFELRNLRLKSATVLINVTPGPLTSPEQAECIASVGRRIDIAKDILLNGYSSIDESLR